MDRRAEPDSTLDIGEPEFRETESGWTLTVPLHSSAWAAKRLVLQGGDDCFMAHVEVEGAGAIAECRLFGGHYAGDRRRGAGFYRSGRSFNSVFNPEPSELERRCVDADTPAAVDVVGTSVPGLRHWFFTPAPFCFGLSRSAAPQDHGVADGPWLMAGLAAEPGEHHFTRFAFDPLEDGFSFLLDYEGQRQVDGHWRSPAMLFTFDAADPYAGIRKYVAHLERLDLVPPPLRRLRPEWWRKPIFCGWGAQSHLALGAGESPDRFATQDHYDRFLAHLEDRGLRPGTVIIDDRWQSAYGSGAVDQQKWPDLKGWIGGRHRAGQHVLLWWKAWDAEGLDPELTVRDAAGRQVAVDPGNPAYEARLRAIVSELISSDGMDADGFKIDFTARTPSGPGLRHSGGAWGAELLHRLLSIIYTEAKRVKPDALIITHTPNPYFRTVTDMIRLNDVNTRQPVLPQMWHRARVAQAACPDLLIDPDNWQMPDLATWRRYLAVQGQIGVPSLYYATHVDLSQESLEEGDYAAIAQAWESAQGT